MSKTIVLTGAHGNIGSAMKLYLENSGHNVVCLNVSPFSLTRIAELLKNTSPTAWINMAAMSADPESYKKPYEYYMANSVGVLNQLEMIRQYSDTTRFLCAGSIYESRHSSPYASSKRISRELVSNFRTNYGIYATQVTLAHTESKNHKTSFLARKITSKVAAISKALISGAAFEPLSLIDIDQKFYWAASEDICDGIFRCLFQDEYSNVIPSIPPGVNKEAFLSKHIKDYSLFSTEQHSIRSFVEIAVKATPIIQEVLKYVNAAHFEWLEIKGEEYYCLRSTSQDTQIAVPLVKNVKSGNKIEQPMRFVQGSSDFAQDELNWVPKITFAQMVQDMVKADLE